MVHLSCSCCGRQFGPDFADSRHCAACNVLRVLNNSIADGVMMITDLTRMRDTLLQEVIAAGGDAARVRRLFHHLWSV